MIIFHESYLNNIFDDTLIDRKHLVFFKICKFGL